MTLTTMTTTSTGRVNLDRNNGSLAVMIHTKLLMKSLLIRSRSKDRESTESVVRVYMFVVAIRPNKNN